MRLSFEIDKLTHSIERSLTSEVYQTEVFPFNNADLRTTTKRNGWRFNWKTEFSTSDKQVFKLVLQQQPEIIQGLVCLSVMSDHLYMNLIETAPHNFGKNKQFIGVLGNLVAYVCKLSFEYGFDGEMAFDAKTVLIEHYEKELGARHWGGQRMVIWRDAAIKLTNRYFPDFIIL